MIRAGYDHDRSRYRTNGRQWLDSLWHAWRGWRIANRLARSGQTVGILCGFPQLTACVALIKRITGSRRPLVGWAFNLNNTGERVTRRLAGFALRSVDRLVVHSRREIDVYARAFSLPREVFRFVPFGVEDLTPDPALTEDTDPPFVLAMGSAGRDYETLIGVVRSLGVPLVIVAGQHAVDGLTIPDGVTVRSGLTPEDCHALTQRARVCVVPLANTVTAVGQVTVIESMLLGKAVVATDTVGTEDYVQDGDTGVLVPPADGDALAVAIRRLWNAPEVRASLGCAARDRIRATSIYPVTGRIMAEVLAEAAAAASRRPD